MKYEIRFESVTLGKSIISLIHSSSENFELRTMPLDGVGKDYLEIHPDKALDGCPRQLPRHPRIAGAASPFTPDDLINPIQFPSVNVSTFPLTGSRWHSHLNRYLETEI